MIPPPPIVTALPRLAAPPVRLIVNGAEVHDVRVRVIAGRSYIAFARVHRAAIVGACELLVGTSNSAQRVLLALRTQVDYDPRHGIISALSERFQPRSVTRIMTERVGARVGEFVTYVGPDLPGPALHERLRAVPPTRLIDGSIWIPLRRFAAFGRAAVVWDQRTRTVELADERSTPAERAQEAEGLATLRDVFARSPAYEHERSRCGPLTRAPRGLP